MSVPDPACDAAAGLGDYLGAEQTVNEHEPGPWVTLRISAPLFFLGLAALPWHLVAGITLMLLAITTAAIAWRRPTPPPYTLYCYDRGLVRHRPGTIDTFLWSALVSREGIQQIKESPTAGRRTIPWLRLRTSHGRSVAYLTGDAATRINTHLTRP